MARININVGGNANDGTGDDLRSAMQKINTNFTELYGTTAEANDLIEDGSPQLGGDLDLQNFIITTGLTNGNISLQPNGTGSVLLKNIRITDNVISSDDSTSITVNESLVVTGSANFASTLSAPTVVTNVIRSDDSSIIEINNGLQVAGSVKSTGVITNTLSSEDSTAIQVGDSLNVNGTVTASTVNSDTVNTTELNINNNQILAYNSNSDIKLTTSGTGAIDVDGARIKNVAVPTDANDAATKSWVEGYVVAGIFASDITMVGDDSTGTAVSLGETFKIAGATGITTAVSGDTLTITGPDLSSYLTNSTITVVGDDSTGVVLNTGETIKIAGTTGITTAVSGDTLTITGPNLSSYLTDVTINVAGDDSNTISINNSGTLFFNGEQGITTSTNSDGSITITGPNLTNYAQKTDTAMTLVGDDSTGTAVTIGETFKITGTSNITTAVSGDTLTITGPNLDNIVTVVGDDSTGTAFNAGETLKIAGGVGISTAVSGDTITISATGGGGGSIGDLVIEGQTITTGPTNADLTISPNGVGNINLDADRIRVGDLDSNVTISSNGSADLILKTDVDNPSVSGMGSITIGDGVDGVTTLRTSDNGYVSVGNTTWGSLSAVGSRNEHGLAVTMDIDRNLSDVNLERYHASSIGARFNLLGTDPDNGTTVPHRAHQIELVTNLLSKNLISKGWITFDPSSKNAGITSIDSGGQMRGYAGGPVALGVQNQFRNNTVADTTVEETACISSSSSFQHTAAQRTITANNLHGIQQSFDLAASGGDTVADNIRSFVATGNYFTNGSATANNYYAFWAGQASEATNNWGVYIESADWENYLGGLTIVDSTIRADRSNENIYIETAGTGKVFIDATLNVGTVELNNISSADSSAIQINDSVNVSGTLTATTSLVTPSVVTNAINSSDSSSVTINDDLEVKSQLFVNTISSNDSSAIQILDNVECNANLYANDITGAVVQVGSSGSPVNTNQVIDMSAGRHFEIYLSGSITCTLNNFTFSTFKTMQVSNTSGSTRTLTFNGTYSNGSAINFILPLAAGRELLLYWVGGKTSVLLGASEINGTGDIEVNSISSPDSSAITINDGVNISGVLSANTIDTNTISSSDNLTIQINDSVQISDNLTMGGLFTLYNRTVAQLSALTPAAGTMAYCTDETGGAQPVFYDGTNWRRMTDRIVIS